MSSGYRGIIVAAVVGLALLYGFGMGYYHAALNYPQEQRYQPYRAAADQIENVDPSLVRPASTKPFEYRAPCYKPKGKDESDLCAQWRAAKAGENSALWAKWGFWIGAFGSALLLWQIILTRQALHDTGNATVAMREANEIAKNAAERERRPWIKIGHIALSDLGCKKPKVTVDIVNVGWSAAAIDTTHVQTYVARHLPMVRPYQGLEDKSLTAIFERGRKIEAGGGDAATKCVDGFTQEQMAAIMDGTTTLYVMGWVRYFGNGIGRRTMFCRAYCPEKEDSSPPATPITRCSTKKAPIITRCAAGPCSAMT